MQTDPKRQSSKGLVALGAADDGEQGLPVVGIDRSV